MRSYWLVIPLVLLCAAPLLRADTVTLKTGEVINGTIKSQTDTEVTIDIQVSASISDERTIEKTDIAKIEQAQPDQIAYQQLIQTQPNPQSSFSSDAYAQILSQLYQFVATYPNSTYVPDIKKLIAAFEDEKKHVDSGQYKYLGRWISDAEAQKRLPQIEAQQMLSTMQQQASTGDFIGAMQTFSGIEKSFLTTRSYPVAAGLAQAILARLIPQLASQMQAVKVSEAQMKQTIAFTQEPAKTNLIRQNKAEQDRAAALVAASLRAGAIWVPLIPDSEVSINTLQRTAGSVAQHINSIPVATMTASVAKVDTARNAMATKDYSTANVLLQQATSLWVQNEDARYALEQLKEAVATPTPTPTPRATPTPRPTMTPRPEDEMAAFATPTPVPKQPFYMTIPGALAIVAGVLVLAGVVAAMSKLKGRGEDD